MFQLNNYKPTKIYKIKKKKYIFDPIRKKLILLTPEEIVRQGFIQYLINDMGVPKDLLEVYVPMSYFNPTADGRADIIVYADKDNKRVPILVVECKSQKTPFIDPVYDYEEVLYSNTIVVTNGSDLFVETWDERTNSYLPLESLPDYLNLLSAYNFIYSKREPFNYRRLRFEDYTKEENLNFYKRHFHGITDLNLQTFIINLNELLWDDTVKIPYDEMYGIKLVEDIGVRYTKFGNAAGYDWTGDYRSIIVEDEKGSNQIISIAILEGYLIVAIDNDKYSHNSLQLYIQDFVQVHGDLMLINHNGRLTLGKSGMVKFEEIISFIEEKDSKLINQDRKVRLGLIDNSKQLNWEQEDVKEFFGRLIKYALVRDDFREYKRKQLKKEDENKLFRHAFTLYFF
ncbi:type I restriction enzyme HsdR N-terminal domain-containing protein [Neobacillus sp. YX16]|uniref:type I restriction enzyme HsdR N-terminal domain-containing protein n=1 Tax=Neobacillus sp. YX16 TaxID=3047874 RepID=UPI0024C2FA50|nr:type I restriction enzyme HsdR N-terminal domain-containing protein [Neobacillus sp. YX16]WHZ02843.1 type I restriction enzyme HsdR N-terminal domain-containing protein [Neobacillus sp. YX16]